MSIRERLEKIFDRKTWEENNTPIPKPLTSAERVEEYKREYHRNTYTKLYISTYEL